MTKEQQQWASEHDWFVCYSHTLNRVTVWEQENSITRVFTDFNKLREWAGY